MCIKNNLNQIHTHHTHAHTHVQIDSNTYDTHTRTHTWMMRTRDKPQTEHTAEEPYNNYTKTQQIKNINYFQSYTPLQ